MLVEGEAKQIAEKVVDMVFEKVGEVAGEVSVKRVSDLFTLISDIGRNRLNYLREEIRRCQKME